MRKFRKCPSFQGVAAGQTATLNLPVVGTYYTLKLLYATATGGGATQANMEAEITQIRLKVNGVEQRRFTARELFDVNSYRGQSVEDGILTIFLAEPWRPTVQGEDAYAWGMGGGISSFTIEVDFAGGAGVTSLECLREWSPVTTNMGLISKWRKFNLNASAAGVVQFQPPIREAYIGFHMDMASVTVNDVEVTVDEEQDFDEATKTQIDSVYKHHGFVPHADWFHVMKDGLTGRAADVWAMIRPDGRRVSDFRIDVDAAGAGNVPILAEVLGPRSA